MKIKELKKALLEMDESFDDCNVILQADSEGNGYSPLAGIDIDCVYRPKYGEVYSTSMTAEDNGMSEEEYKELLKEKRCLVLFPI